MRKHMQILVLMLGLLFTAVACDSVQLAIEPIQPTTPANTGGGGGSSDWYEIYFTKPSCPDEAQRHGGA